MTLAHHTDPLVPVLATPPRGLVAGTRKGRPVAGTRKGRPGPGRCGMNTGYFVDHRGFLWLAFGAFRLRCGSPGAPGLMVVRVLG